MAYMLKDRNKQIPNGFKFLQPETGWSPRPFSSFSVVCNSLMRHRMANPALVAKHRWPTDLPSIEVEVENYNVALCVSHGWLNYLNAGDGGGAPLPKFQAPPASLLEKVRSVAVGAETLVEWLKSGAEAVDRDLADRRALGCSACEKNDRGDWTRWFTIPVSRAISMFLEKRRSWKLATLYDDELGVCSACLCPLKLKVNVPAENILIKMPPETFEALDPKCWLRAEKKAMLDKSKDAST
jgi:hypothetical protein